jgi:hypothetical protein
VTLSVNSNNMQVGKGLGVTGVPPGFRSMPLSSTPGCTYRPWPSIRFEEPAHKHLTVTSHVGPMSNGKGKLSDPPSRLLAPRITAPRTGLRPRPSKAVERAKARPAGSQQMLSELHLSATSTAYQVVCAAPGMKLADMRHSVEGHVVRVANGDEPERELFPYVLRERLPVYTFPSLSAPRVGTLEAGERARGYLPVHFWVSLAQSQGWVHDPGRSALQVLGRPPLTAEEASDPRGFARFLRLPDDALPETATPSMDGGFFCLTFERSVQQSYM